MAATRKSAKRTAAKKRTSAKRSPAKKSARAKASSKRRTKGIAKKAGKAVGKAKKKARKVVRAARGPINTVMNAGGKTWKALKSTTAQMVEGVRGTFGGDESSSR
jgi:cell division septum initiation protein DivIVA